MLYFLTSDVHTKQLEAYTVKHLRRDMIDSLGWYTTDLTTKQLIDEIVKHYKNSCWSFVAWNKKDAIEVLKDWGVSNEEIKQLFQDIIVNK